MSEQNGHAAVLRAGGFDDAAAFLDAVDQASAMRTVDEVEQPQPPAEPQRQPTDPEVQQRAEAEYLLSCLRRDLPDVVNRADR